MSTVTKTGKDDLLIITITEFQEDCACNISDALHNADKRYRVMKIAPDLDTYDCKIIMVFTMYMRKVDKDILSSADIKAIICKANHHRGCDVLIERHSTVIEECMLNNAR